MPSSSVLNRCLELTLFGGSSALDELLPESIIWGVRRRLEDEVLDAYSSESDAMT